MSEPATSTLALEERMNKFIANYQAELNQQAKRPNHASEVRMRKLLRRFNQEIYVPYRDETLGRE